MYNMLKMKKMNGLKIFALVLLSLSKFETMFGMKENKFDDEYLNKNYYLIDDLGNKITLDNGEDIKFKIYLDEEIEKMIFDRNKDILKIHENEKEKTLVITTSDNEKEEETYLTPIIYMNGGVFVAHEKKDDDELDPLVFILAEKDRKEYEENTIRCRIIKKIGEDSMNDDYILVDAKNNKIEKIEDKNIVFKLLTRKKYLELKEKINNHVQFLKDKEKYILDNLQNPLFFEEGKNNDLILYVKRSKDDLCLAGLNLKETITTIEFNKDNYILVRMVKKKEIPMVKKEVDNDSSKCCCGIC